MGRVHKITRGVMHAALVEVGITKVVVIIAVVLLALVAAVTLGFRHSIMTVNQLDRRAEQVLVANYLERQGAASIAQQKVQLTWDDAFKAAAHRVDPSWTDTYLGDFLYANFGYELIYLVDPQGRLLRSWENGEPGGELSYRAFASTVREELQAMTGNAKVFGKVAELRTLSDTRWPFDAHGKALTRWAKLPAAYKGRSGQLTIASIVPDTRMEMLEWTPNHLVAVRFYDAAFLEQLRADLLLSPVASEPTKPLAADANGLALVDEDGRTQGWLTWKFVARGEVIQQRMRPLFVAFVCIMLALLTSGAAILRGLSRAHDRLREREAEALLQVRQDSLTGLVSRGYLVEQLEAKLSELDQYPERGVSLAYIDLDNFKFVNDTLGHPAGDELLRQVAQRCIKRLPSSDLLARMGGDEFVLVRCEPLRKGAVSELGSELMALFAAPFKVDGRIIDVTASCGIAWAPEQTLSAEELLRKADIALYQAKNRGRARWRVFTPDMAARVSRRIAFETELRKALQRDLLTIAYQPIVRASDGTIEGAEALLRWEHPEFGAVSPGLFVPVAEQAGLMPQLGWWTLGRVFEQHRAFPNHNVSINLSPLQLTGRGFLNDLALLVKEHNVKPAKVTFEVTEGILLERGSGVFDVLEGLRQMGFGLALDDFGTGYSSLSYLRTFRFDRLKIDRSFVQNIENERDAHSILKTIVALGRDLETRTVAEGVETLIQRELVVAAGCELIQGYYHYRPMSLQAFCALLEAERAGPKLRLAAG
jgi:diguanylate cyclase (GGDEF)-like protein